MASINKDTSNLMTLFSSYLSTKRSVIKYARALSSIFMNCKRNKTSITKDNISTQQGYYCSTSRYNYIRSELNKLIPTTQSLPTKQSLPNNGMLFIYLFSP